MELLNKVTLNHVGCVILALLQAVWADDSETYINYETTTCDRVPVDGYPYHFIQYHSAFDWSIQACPSGYYFSELACDCMKEALPAKPTERKRMAPEETLSRMQIPVTKKEIVYKAEPTDRNLLVLLNPPQTTKKTTTTITTTPKTTYITKLSTTTTSKPKSKTTTCDRVPVDGYPYHFIQYSSENDWSIQACPSGYYFSELACDCMQEASPAKPTERKIMAPEETLPRIQIPITKKEIVYKAEPTDRNLLVLLNPPQPIEKTTTTITTTTTAKTTYPTKAYTTTTPKPKSKSLCDGCILEGGVGYNPHPSDCNKFIICYTSLGKLREDNRSCPHGKYWDQDVKTCQTSEQVKCKQDKCLEPGLKTYRHDNKCGEYWECLNGVSIARCCQSGYAYIERVGCVIDITCKSRCDQKDEPKHYICDKIGVIGKPHEFKQAQKGFGYIDMKCAPGTVYSTEICGCIFAAPENKNYSKMNSAKCKPELDLNFNNGKATDSSRNDVHVQVHNVTFQSGAACFHGNSALVIPRFANADIGETFVVRMKYRLSDFGETNDIQALMYNGDCGQEPTIIIGANRDENYFRLKTTDEYYTDITFKKLIDGWRTIEMFLNQGIFSVSIDKQLVAHKPLKGSIAKSQCGLKVGWGHSLRAFNGCIDFVSVYTCPP